ncbi:MAG: glycosyltransferase [Paraglaciecola sp.]|uniref:glycosyltransferase n=1 Tax=Paraglaciecola sp. TaxID=1920173 RepID=UPI003299315F
MFRFLPSASLLKKQSLRHQIKLIEESGLFDEEWYLEQNIDVKESAQNPIKHYIQFGASEGRTPSPKFDQTWYLTQYQDVANAGLNPLVHYIEHGIAEGRSIHANDSKAQSIKPSTPAGELNKKLWGGFSEHAVIDLEKFAYDENNKKQERAQALFSLSRWYSTAKDWTNAYRCLKDIRPLDIKLYRNKRTKLLLIESLLQLGQVDKAADFLEPTLAQRFDSDFLCALCNSLESSEQRLAVLNKIYSHYGLSQVSFSDQSKGMQFGNLTVATPPKTISGGSKISILVPVYNAEDFITVAMQSLLEQSWSNIEIIAVDDCSTDNSFVLLEEMASADSRLKIAKNSVNQGAYGTRNKALSLATGDFITVHDSDDWSHPQMLEIQMGAMLSNPRLKITCSMMARVHSNMQFMLRPQRNNLDYVHRSYPSVLLRKQDLEALGEWDGVSANADDEFVQRARMLWGKDSVKDILTGVPLSFFLVHENSLTQNKKTSLNSLTFGIRQEYSRQANYWKSKKVEPNSKKIVTNRESLKEPFPIPAGLAPNNWPLNRHYDLVIISDLSLLGGTRRCNEGYISAALDSGLRVGLFHWPRYDLKVAEIADEYMELSYNENVDILVPEDDIDADLVIIHHPPILKYEIDAVPTIDCKKVAILVNQSPMQLWSEKPHYYSEQEVNELSQKLFGQDPVWIAISAVVEKTLALAGGGNNLLDEIWFPPYSHDLPDTVPEPPVDLGTDRPIVLGRHSRDHWTKWPESQSDLLNAYCVNKKGVAVHLLGGAKTPKKVLGKLPKNWKVFEFDSIEVTEFIKGLDFFLHFTHEDYIEEFGRNIMEAMATGRVVILPESYEKVFGDAAVYCKPSKVEDTIRELWSDKDKYTAQTQHGFAFVVENCSRPVVARKILNLLK